MLVFFFICLLYTWLAGTGCALEALQQQGLAAISECLVNPFDVWLREAHRLVLAAVGLSAVDALEPDAGAAAAGERAAYIKFARIELGGTADAGGISTASAARLRRCLCHMHNGALLMNWKRVAHRLTLITLYMCLAHRLLDNACLPQPVVMHCSFAPGSSSLMQMGWMCEANSKRFSRRMMAISLLLVDGLYDGCISMDLTLTSWNGSGSLVLPSSHSPALMRTSFTGTLQQH